MSGKLESRRGSQSTWALDVRLQAQIQQTGRNPCDLVPKSEPNGTALMIKDVKEAVDIVGTPLLEAAGSHGQ